MKTRNALKMAGIAVAAALILRISWPAAAHDGHDHAAPTTAPAKDEHADHDHPPSTVPATGAAAVEHQHDDHDHDHGKEAGAHSAHSDEVKLTAEAIQRHGIRIAPARMQSLAPTFVAPARVSFNTDAMAHVGSLVKGRVTKLNVRVGDVVKKEDVLAVVESAEFGEAQSDFLQKQTAVEVAEGSVELTKSAYDRAVQLQEQSQGIALSEFQRREGEYKTAQAAAKTAHAALTAARNTLKLMGMQPAAIDALAKNNQIDPTYAIRAPLDGQVTEREITLGELVSSDRHPLLVLANTDTLWVLADVPEARLGQVTVGTKARVQIAALPGETLEGKVSHIGHSVESDTRTARVRIEIPSNPALRPGMFARVEITAGGPSAQGVVLVVPEEAVQTVEGSPSVFVPVAGEENTFAKRAVSIGKSVGGMTPLLSGVKEGESVVISGTFILKAELGKSEASHEH